MVRDELAVNDCIESGREDESQAGPRHPAVEGGAGAIMDGRHNSPAPLR